VVSDYFAVIMGIVNAAGRVPEILKHETSLRNYYEWSMMKGLE
jgi:hypothetical protein